MKSLSPLRRLATLLLLFLLHGCTSLPPEVEKQASAAFDHPAQTSLGRMALASALPHRGESGFLLQETGRQAFLQRATLIEAAERSIDAQYYIWNTDISGRYLALRLLLAAQRGVRVRLLLDDFNVAGRDAVFAALDSHPNIEIRIYNPFATRTGPGRLLEAVGDFQRINRRMHNKTFVVDAAFGIVGGRNIGDEYFGLDPQVNFLDRDMLAVGPIVGDISANFDLYWNSPAAYPIADLADRKLQPAQIGQMLESAQADASNIRGLDCTPPQQAGAALDAASQWLSQLEWAPAELVFSEPIPTELPAIDRPAPTAIRLGELLRSSRREVQMESAYFILGERELEGVRQLNDRGVVVKSITNSLASNDLVGNHAGYARSREGMLASGIQLHELRPDGQICARCTFIQGACPGDISLHAKSMVVDRSTLYVGSFNLNLRSIYLNGETALIVHSPYLATRVAESIELAMQPANSWAVTNDPNGGLQWAGAEGVYRHEPDTSWWQRFKAALIGLLPIEKYL